jgi:hypothetical protein
MKQRRYFSFFMVSLIWGVSMFWSAWGVAQTQDQKKAPIIILPQGEQKRPTIIDPQNQNPLFLGISGAPNVDLKDLEEKGPSMTMEQKERFLDPGERYLKKLQRDNTPENQKNPNQFRVDQYLGDFRNNGKFVQILLRDHESPDGDLIRIMVNDKEIVPRILLEERFKGVSIDLMPGFNKIDFVALNQGASGPNTAEVRVFDDQGNLVGANRWNLATGVKATYIVVKE